jgi:xanthine dehydrogenase molybdenum-binding subunit
MNGEGRLMNSSLLEYRMPTSRDVSMIETVLIEVPNPGHPFGVRVVGEACMMPPLAAIANAVYNVMGLSMRDLPMSPVVMLRTLQEKD